MEIIKKTESENNIENSYKTNKEDFNINKIYSNSNISPNNEKQFQNKNHNKIKEIKRICHKLDPSSENNIAQLIKNKFQNVEEFLEIDNDIVIGKLIDTQKYEKLEELKSYQIIGDKNELINIHNNNHNDSLGNNNYLNSANKSIGKSMSRSTKNYILSSNSRNLQISPRKNKINNKENSDEGRNIIKITDEQLGQFYKERRIKTAKNNNRNKVNEEIFKKTDYKCATEMKGILNKQENILNFKENKDNKIDKIANKISNVTQKNKKELLMNTYDVYRIKNQCLNKINLNEPEKIFEFGVYNNWVYSLRKIEGRENIKKTITDKNKILKKDYIFTQMDLRKDSDIGAIIFPHLIKGNDENIIKPNSASIKDFRKYASSRAVSSKLRKMNIDCEEFILGNDLNVRIYIIYYL
jgi:hypothetical protein